MKKLNRMRLTTAITLAWLGAASTAVQAQVIELGNLGNLGNLGSGGFRMNGVNASEVTRLGQACRSFKTGGKKQIKINYIFSTCTI